MRGCCGSPEKFNLLAKSGSRRPAVSDQDIICLVKNLRVGFEAALSSSLYF